MAAISTWSTSAGSNNSSPPDGFPENMSPSGVNNSAREVMAAVRLWYENVEWRDFGHTVTRTGNTTFTIAADVTSTYVANRPIRCTDSSTLYGYIASSSYSAPNTTVTVTLDSGNLSASLTAVSLGPTPSTQSIPVQAIRNQGAALLAATNTWTGTNIFTSGLIPSNLKLAATVGSNALTIAIKGNDGNDPSSTNPVYIPFRNVTVATGDTSGLSVTSATSLVVSSGSTLGTVSGTEHRLYVCAFNDGGTFRLGIYNPYNATNGHINGFDSGSVASSTAEGGAGAADSAQVIYTGTAVSSRALTILGYVESTQATAGTWATTPSKVHVLRLGDLKTGDVVQRILVVDSTNTSTTTVIPADNTVPDVTADSLTEYSQMARSITPSSAINLLEFEANLVFTTSVDLNGLAMIVKSGTDPIKAVAGNATGGASRWAITIVRYIEAAGGTSSQTWRVYYGPADAGTMYLNTLGGTARYGGTLRSTFSIIERFV